MYIIIAVHKLKLKGIIVKIELYEVAVYYSSGGTDLLYLEEKEFSFLTNFNISGNPLISLTYRVDKHDIKRDIHKVGEKRTIIINLANINRIQERGQHQLEIYEDELQLTGEKKERHLSEDTVE